MTSTKGTRQGVKPSPEEQRKASRLIDEKGIVEAAETVGCARETLMRVAAGLPVNRGTLALVREKIPR